MPHSIAGQAIDVGRVSSTLGAFSIESMVIGVGIYSHLHMSDGYAKSAGQPRTILHGFLSVTIWIYIYYYFQAILIVVYSCYIQQKVGESRGLSFYFFWKIGVGRVSVLILPSTATIREVQDVSVYIIEMSFAMFLKCWIDLVCIRPIYVSSFVAFRTTIRFKQLTAKPRSKVLYRCREGGP